MISEVVAEPMSEESKTASSLSSEAKSISRVRAMTELMGLGEGVASAGDRLLHAVLHAGEEAGFLVGIGALVRYGGLLGFWNWIGIRVAFTKEGEGHD